MLSLGGFLISCFTLQFRMPIAQALRLFDYPDDTRRLHAAVTPKTGSIAFIITLFAVLIDQLVNGRVSDHHRFFLYAIIAAHFIIGIYDDRVRFQALARFNLSIVTCYFMLTCDGAFVAKQISLSNGLTIPLGQTSSLLATVFALVAFIYAVNLIDGKNGILGLCAIIWLALLAISGLSLTGLELVALFGTLSVFLAYNLAGKVFAGDAGAYVVGAGIGLGALGIYEGGTASTVFFDQLLVWFALPTFDIVRVTFRRMFRGMNVASAGTDHFHHLLWRRLGDTRGLMVYGAMVAVPSAITLVAPTASLAVLGLTLVTFFGLVIWCSLAPRPLVVAKLEKDGALARVGRRPIRVAE
jgi:UDP-GlcNAc:undecaprenyl-phosphate/decaprenyl-phosphate GlcNAc-1-phosphate transferase